MRKINLAEYISRIPLGVKLFYYDFLGGRPVQKEEVYYGEHPKQYYRLYRGESTSKPIIFFIHGGGWWHGSPRVLGAIAKFFHKRGYTIVMPAYRLVPTARYPEQTKDIASAFSKVLEDLKLAHPSVVVMGFSAGGELATRLVFDQELHNAYGIDKKVFKSLITLAGVLDFMKCKNVYANLLIKNYLGDEMDQEGLNPIHLVQEATCPVLCLHGEKDEFIDKENSISLSERVKKIGGLSQLIYVKKAHHSDLVTLFIGKGRRETIKILEFIETGKVG